MLSCWDFSFEKFSKIILYRYCVLEQLRFFTFSIQICGNNAYSIRYRPECAIYLRSFKPISELHYDTYFVFMTLESVDSYFYVSRLSSDLFKYLSFELPSPVCCVFKIMPLIGNMLIVESVEVCRMY